MPKPFYQLSAEESLAELKTTRTGLTTIDALARQKIYGQNVLPNPERLTAAKIFINQFRNSFVFVLLIAAAISFFFGEHLDAYVIIAIVIINAIMGFFQEYKAEKSIEALRQMVSPVVKTYRDDELVELPAAQLVPGDVILLEAGDRITADGRLLFCKKLSINESSLTGESVPSTKTSEVIHKEVPLADQLNMVWMGTNVTNGEAEVVITNIGATTAIGMVATSIENTSTHKDHFQQKVNRLSQNLSILAVGGALLTFSIGYFIRGFDFTEIFLFTIASLVSAIPEGLPIVLVFVLALGAHRMSRRKAIIRKLSAIETLAATDVIVTDKTGTLTQNVMSVTSIMLPTRRIIDVSGSGWEPIGTYSENQKPLVPLEDTHIDALLHAVTINNNAWIIKENEHYTPLGDPTETAQVVLAAKAGLKKDVLEATTTVLDELPFDPELKIRAALIQATGNNILYVTGAPEQILQKTSTIQAPDNIAISDEDRSYFEHHVMHLTNSAIRSLAVASRIVPAHVHIINEELLSDLTLLGILGIKDPVRPDVSKAINLAQQAGIRVIMATGDHKGTGVAIAKEIGLFIDEHKGIPLDEQAFTEQDLLNLSDRQFDHAVRQGVVFARLTPGMKVRIAKSLQKHGHVVAMTGDGVNDAPALKTADIGISMGTGGTDVAREASEIVLTDNNFATIINAVEEGRVIFNNIRRTTLFLVTTSVAEIVILTTTLLVFLPLPLLPVHVLWLNLITDGFAVIALATETGHSHVLSSPPRKKEEPILTRNLLGLSVLVIALMTFVTIFVYTATLPSGIAYARTCAFLAMGLTQLFNLLNLRSLKKPIYQINMFGNRWINLSLALSIALILAVINLYPLNSVFRLISISTLDVIGITLLSSLIFFGAELYKLVAMRLFNHR